MATGGRLPELRILLIGRTGHGKSSTGNSILGKDIFVVSRTSQSCTKEALTQESERFNLTIRVTDTPGYFDTELSKSFRSQDSLRRLLMKCLFTTIPGLDGILFILRYGEKFTPELQETQQLFFDWFGPGVEDYAYLVITHCDSQEDAEKYALDGSHDSLRSLARMCGDRIIPIENKETKRTELVRQMIDRIRQGKERNGGASFTDIKYNIITHIAKTRDPREISQESLLILKKAKPDVERFLVSKGFKMIDSKVSSTTSITEENIHTPGNINGRGSDTAINSTSGNVKVIDDSFNKVGLFYKDHEVKKSPSSESKASDRDQITSASTEDNCEQSQWYDDKVNVPCEQISSHEGAQEDRWSSLPDYGITGLCQKQSRKPTSRAERQLYVPPGNGDDGDDGTVEGNDTEGDECMGTGGGNVDNHPSEFQHRNKGVLNDKGQNFRKQANDDPTVVKTFYEQIKEFFNGSIPCSIL